MEWTMAINDILRDEITKLNHTLIPPGFHGDVRTIRIIQELMAKIINTLGEQSATAQGLNKVITTAEKLQSSPEHYLYLLKDPHAKGGKGDVIGMLKVGRKHLFLFDERDKVHEVEPQCVLDFYVLADRQRHGYGRKLFDFMLKDLGCAPWELAVDGPSPKMEQFLAKTYGVERMLRQNNNFAVAPTFFGNPHDISSRCAPSPAAATPVGRYAAHKPASSIASVIHGGGGDPRPHEPATNGVSAPASPTRERSASPESRSGSAAAPPADAEWVAKSATSPERPSSLQVRPATATATASAADVDADAGADLSADTPSARRDSQLTARGYFDVKFYHNKLW